MKKTILPMVFVGALTACQPESQPMTCGDYSVDVELINQGAQLNAAINETMIVLDLVVSASGAKYDGVLGDKKITLWNKGDTWTMFINDGKAIVCE